MAGKIKSLQRLKTDYKSKKRDAYLLNIQKTLWNGEEIPNLPVEAVADLATELFSSSCGARKLAGLHLPEAVRESCKGRISPCSLVLALLYLERLKSGGENASDYLNSVTPSELFIISMLVANKFLQDEGVSSEVENWFWSELSGLEVKHINILEKEFLSAIQWEVFVSRAEFWRRLHNLHRVLALRQGLCRGWFTYNEMSSLLDNLKLPALFQNIIEVYAACVASYTAAALSLVVAAVFSAHIQRCLLALPNFGDSQLAGVMNESPSLACVPEQWHLPILPTWQVDIENSTHEYSSGVVTLHLNTTTYTNQEASHDDDDDSTRKILVTWQHIISHNSPASTYAHQVNKGKAQVIPLFPLKEII